MPNTESKFSSELRNALQQLIIGYIDNHFVNIDAAHKYIIELVESIVPVTYKFGAITDFEKGYHAAIKAMLERLR